MTFAFGGLEDHDREPGARHAPEADSRLWAVGNSTAEFFYGNYPGGSALSRGATFGRRPAETRPPARTRASPRQVWRTDDVEKSGPATGPDRRPPRSRRHQQGFFVTEREFPEVEGELRDTLLLEVFGSPDPSRSTASVAPSPRRASSCSSGLRPRRRGRRLHVRAGRGQPARRRLVGQLWEPHQRHRDVRAQREPRRGRRRPDDGDAVQHQHRHAHRAVDSDRGRISNTVRRLRHRRRPGTGARVDSKFFDPAGGVFGSLSPTGNFRDTVTVEGEEYEVSLVDATNPCVFVRAADLGPLARNCRANSRGSPTSSRRSNSSAALSVSASASSRTLPTLAASVRRFLYRIRLRTPELRGLARWATSTQRTST